MCLKIFLLFPQQRYIPQNPPRGYLFTAHPFFSNKRKEEDESFPISFSPSTKSRGLGHCHLIHELVAAIAEFNIFSECLSVDLKASLPHAIWSFSTRDFPVVCSSCKFNNPKKGFSEPFLYILGIIARVESEIPRKDRIEFHQCAQLDFPLRKNPSEFSVTAKKIPWE